MAVEITSYQSPRKNVAGREDRTRDRPPHLTELSRRYMNLHVHLFVDVQF